MSSDQGIIPFPVPVARDWRIVRAAILERLESYPLCDEAIAGVLAEMEAFWRVLSAPIDIDFSILDAICEPQKVRALRAAASAAINSYQGSLMSDRLDREISLALSHEA